LYSPERVKIEFYLDGGADNNLWRCGRKYQI